MSKLDKLIIVGTKVKCIDNKEFTKTLTVGKYYTVTGLIHDTVWVDGMKLGFKQRRFEVDVTNSPIVEKDEVRGQIRKFLEIDSKFQKTVIDNGIYFCLESKAWQLQKVQPKFILGQTESRTEQLHYIRGAWSYLDRKSVV